jgi:hypothetical protein
MLDWFSSPLNQSNEWENIIGRPNGIHASPPFHLRMETDPMEYMPHHLYTWGWKQILFPKSCFVCNTKMIGKAQEHSNINCNVSLRQGPLEPSYIIINHLLYVNMCRTLKLLNIFHNYWLQNECVHFDQCRYRSLACNYLRDFYSSVSENRLAQCIRHIRLSPLTAQGWKQNGITNIVFFLNTNLENR